MIGDFDFTCIQGLGKTILDEASLVNPWVTFTGSVFNPTVIRLPVGKSLYLMSGRASLVYLYVKKGLFSPGNSKKCTNAINLNPSDVFFWNNWGQYVSVGENSVFFLIDSSSVKWIPVFMSDKRVILPGGFLEADDYRLAWIDEQPVLYDRDLKNYYTISFQKGQVPIQSSEFSGPNPDIIGSRETEVLILTKHPTGYNRDGINLTPLTFGIGTDQVTIYLDWFYRKGVRIGYANQEDGVFRKEYIPTDPNYPIVGSGSYDSKTEKDRTAFRGNYGIMPLFSFSTPFVKYQGELLAVGHIKIHTDEEMYPYLEGSKIQNFRREVHERLRNDPTRLYHPHLGTFPQNRPGIPFEPQKCKGYIYLFYFFRLNRRDNSILISDAYLPVSPVDTLEHSFSLFFPIGLVLEEEMLTVTGGYGDYYPMSLHFNVRDAFDDCRHSISKLRMVDYDYHMI